jgi:low temperature requirement protein LtrA
MSRPRVVPGRVIPRGARGARAPSRSENIRNMNEPGKRVSWVELYLDLVFVLAVGQLAHLLVAHPDMQHVWIVLGLFFVLWWTWVGFAVLYNRHGADDGAQRLLFLAGSVPAGVAAVAIEPASSGDVAVFALSLAAIRVVLAAAYGYKAGRTDLLRLRITRACITSAALFAISAAVPAPFRYVLWAIGIGVESGAMLAEDRDAMRRARQEHDFSALAPVDPSEALDAHHFAERFGLFLIILLGEVVVEAGQASVDGNVATTQVWTALVAAMILAAALWWVYFDSAAEVNLKVLELSGGSPTMARAIFAVGHMLPAFALLITAAGVGLLLEDDPPHIAAWLACVGIGIYLLGTRVFLVSTGRASGLARALLLVATFQLGRLAPAIGSYAYVWLLAGWVVMCAALTTRTARDREQAGDVEGFLGRREGVDAGG